VYTHSVCKYEITAEYKRVKFVNRHIDVILLLLIFAGKVTDNVG